MGKSLGRNGLYTKKWRKSNLSFQYQNKTNFKEELFNGNEHLIVHLEYVIIVNDDYLMMKIAWSQKAQEIWTG